MAGWQSPGFGGNGPRPKLLIENKQLMKLQLVTFGDTVWLRTCDRYHVFDLSVFVRFYDPTSRSRGHRRDLAARELAPPGNCAGAWSYADGRFHGPGEDI